MADTSLTAPIRQLRAAQPGWARLSPETRADVLRAFAAQLEKRRKPLVAALTADTGRTRLSDAEVDDTIALIHHWAAQLPEILTDSEGRSFQPSAMAPSLKWSTQLVPYPVVGFITPWNFPLTMALIDAVPALAAGCAVIIKPSEHVPEFISPLRDTIAEVPELANICVLVRGGPETGAEMVDEVDHICFTGSVEIGRKIAIAAARRLIPATLELGGKDPAIVTASADLDVAADTILRGATTNSGQSCLSIERVYVVGDSYQPLLDLLVKKVRSLEGDDLPPLKLAKQNKNLIRQLSEAEEKGAQILFGGPSDNSPNWQQSIVSGANHDMALMREESFAPVIPVMQVHSVSEAITLANDSEYGLSAAVFAGSEEEALQIARQLKVGAVSINDCGLMVLTAEPERNAFGVSGLGGSRSGPAAIHRFLRRKALIVQQGKG